MSCWHPDIEEFITAKQTPGRLDKFNMSVLVTDDFMNAVINNDKWDLVFPDFDKAKEIYNEIWDGNIKKWVDEGHPLKVYKTFKDANELWDLIMKSTFSRNEPGVLFIDTVNRLNNLYYKEYISSSNPCVVGETLIATADGRNAVSIKQLADEREDIPVYSTNIDGKVEIKWGRNPRLTGKKKEVWKLVLDDGSEFISTPDHKIYLKNNTYVELKDLKSGDSISSFYSFASNKNYRQISQVGHKMGDGIFRNRRQYRIIYEFFNGTEIDYNLYRIHHKDFDSKNDSIKNLELMLTDDHKKLHSDRIIGDANPYHRMSDEQKFAFASHPGEKNPKYSGITNEILLKKAKELYKREGKFTIGLWLKFAKEEGLPHTIHNDFRFKSFSNFKNQIVDNHKVVSVEFYGYEDVYNITVDDNHNYNVITSFEDDRYITSGGICVKNCGEQLLPIGGICLLGNLNLTQFIKEDFSGWDYDKLKEIIPIAVRFMDNVNDLTYVPLDDQKQNLKNKRRIGLGVLGYGSALLIMKKRYGSKEVLKLTEELMSFIANTAYQSSALLAKEKGAFLFYDEEKYLKSNYLEVLSKETKDLIKKHGIRNSHLLSIQPTGNSSILANVASGGLEPVFLFEYVRTVIQPYPPEGLALPQNVDWVNQTFNGNQNWKWIKEGDENMLKVEFNGDVYKYDKGRGILKESVVKDYGVRFLEERGEWDHSADWAANINNLKIEDHINTMKVISKYIDSSMSKCVVEGTLISTNKGIIPIESLSDNITYDTFSEPNNNYKVLDENGNLKNISKHYVGGEKDSYNIKFSNGFDVNVAYTHKFKTENGWKNVLELQNDDIIFYRSDKIQNDNEYIKLKNKPDFYNSVKYKHPEIIDENYAKFIGMLLSDGFINKNSIGIVEKNGKDGNEIDRLFEILFNVKPKITIDKKNNVKYHFLNSRPMVKFYKNFIGDNDLNKNIPQEILLSNDNVKKSFLSGLSLDGYLKTDDKNLVIYCGYSKNISLKTSYILSSLGYEYHIQEKNVKNGKLSKKMYIIKSYLTSKEIIPLEDHKFEYSISGKKHKQMFVENSYKYDVLPPTKNDNYFLFRNLRKSLRSSSFTRKELLDKIGVEYDDNLTCVKITNIKYIGKRKVYDIEVEDTHSYLINGIVSHNTINLPNEYKYEDFKNVYLELYQSRTIKGGTTYRAGTMATVIKKKEEEAISVSQENNAPKRPKILECDVIRFTNKGERWIGFIGLKDNAPYEIFTGFAESFVVPSWVERGQIRKEKVKNKDGVLVSRYDFVYVDREGYEVIMTGLNRAFQREYWNIGKMTSALLRHRIHLPSVINIIESLNLDGDVMGTWKKGMTRMLRKYVKEDKNDGIATCDNCDSTNLLFKENCISCLDCNWQKCE
jgi:ribonucleotide reductase alpha subunit